MILFMSAVQDTGEDAYAGGQALSGEGLSEPFRQLWHARGLVFIRNYDNYVGKQPPMTERQLDGLQSNLDVVPAGVRGWIELKVLEPVKTESFDLIKD